MENYPLYCPKCRQERLINVYFCDYRFNLHF
ncbi:cysteine-rich KTR domain-containing protein [Campylobacter jejuni]